MFDLRVEREAQKQDIEALLELAEVLQDDARRAQAFLDQMNYAFWVNDFQLARHSAELAILSATRGNDLSLIVQALAGKVQALTSLGDWDAAGQAAKKTLKNLPDVLDARIQALVFGRVARHYHSVGDLSQAALFLTQAAQGARRAGDLRWESRMDVTIGLTYIQLGRYHEARATLEEGLAIAEAIGERGFPCLHLDNLSYVYWWIGDRAKAIELSERALRENRAIAYSPHEEVDTLADLGLYLEEAGEWSVAATYFAASRALFTRWGTNSECLEPQAAEARCMVALGRQEEARQLVNEVWTYLLAHGSIGIFFPARVYVGVADVVSAIEIPGISSGEVIEAGYRDLMQRAEKISDPEWRKSFLEHVRENKSIIERWEKMNKIEIPS